MQLRLKAEGRYDDASEYGGHVATFGEFKRRVAQVASLPLATLRIKVGDPPELVDYPDSTPLASTLISTGCAVTAVDGRSLPSEQPAASEAATVALSHTQCSCHNRSNTNDDGGELGIRDGLVVDRVKFKDGYLVRRTVPSDNSCLFRSLGYALGQVDMPPEQLRELVCRGILDNPEAYNEAVLEKPVGEYCLWISQPASWGGGIEMAVLSETFHVEISSVDTQTLRIDRFGEGKYVRRVILLYSGIHYDYVAFVDGPNTSREFDQTVFSAISGDDSAVLAAAVALADKLRGSQRYYM
ncbi:ubiquitin-specific protease otu1 [Coemansia sp. RSA 2322]|nr:ubiquitin-specific protease otu1 [Coemansia sp. RSA 2322]